MDLDLDVELTEPERRAIFTLLFEMARVDGDVAISETGLLRQVHRAFFDADLEEWTQPEHPDPELVAHDLERAESRKLLIEVLYAMVQVDGLELDDELAFLAQCARAAGLAEPEVREAWNRVAMAIFERATSDLIARSFTSLAREVSRLRRGLFLGAEAEDVAHAMVQRGLDRFELP